jgi:radical SAM superfamily enzyme YgiQ (UPF0313 family)
MKIALAAMSGIRAHDEELMRLGLTLPGFVERSKVIASLPSLGLLTLAGMTPEKHEVTYFEVPDIRELTELPGGFDLVAISSYSAQMSEAYELSDRYRALGVPTVLGGLHVTALPEEAALHADAVVIGEGELSWPALVADCEAGRLKERYGTVDDDFDLSRAPMPAFELLDIPTYNRLTVQTCRGCPHSCEFCASSRLLSKRFKRKPVAKVLAEIDRICSLWRHPFIEFADDNSLIGGGYWRELLPELKKRRIRWFTETDLSVSEDPSLLRLMRESGCAQVLIGLESPVEGDLDGIETTANWKKKQWPRYLEAIDAIQSEGITVNGCFVLGLDSHGPEIFDEVDRFVSRSGLYDVQITVETPFPGSPLRRRLDGEDRLLDTDGWRKCTLFDVIHRPKKMSVEELARGLRELGVRIYSEERVRQRRELFKKRWRAAKRAGRMER